MEQWEGYHLWHRIDNHDIALQLLFLNLMKPACGNNRFEGRRRQLGMISVVFPRKRIDDGHGDEEDFVNRILLVHSW